MTLSLITASVVALSAWGSAQDTTATKAALLAADRAAATSETALAAAIDAHASVLLPDRAILTGRSAFAPHLAIIVRAPVARLAWTPVHAVVSHDGTLGCTTGVLHLTAPDSTMPTTGRYAACWSRTKGGPWRMLTLARVDAPRQVKSLPDSMPGAPGSTGTVAPTNSHAVRAMADADRAFARFSRDSGGPAGAFARWIAKDGMMLGARAVPVRGPEQARAAFAGFPTSGTFEWGPLEPLGHASRDGSLGFTIGEARIAATATDVSYSKYLTIWRRDENGTYKFIFDIGSDRPVPHAK